MVVQFVDIGRIIDHQSLNVFFYHAPNEILMTTLYRTNTSSWIFEWYLIGNKNVDFAGRHLVPF